MIEWINRTEKEPDKSLSSILVFSNCGHHHVAVYDGECDDWVNIECYYGNGGYCIGNKIEFNWWMPLPDPPKE